MKAIPGDEVYFHFRGEPRSGKVLCVGKDGCIVEHAGEQHKLKWGHLAGHKKRVPQNYSVLEHGEDGLIVQNQHGQRRLLSTPPEARLAKHLAVAGGDMVKAVPQAVVQQRNMTPEISIPGLSEIVAGFGEALGLMRRAVEVATAGQVTDRSDLMIDQLRAVSEAQTRLIEAIETLAQTPPVVNIEPVVVPAPVVHVEAPVINMEPVVVPAPVVQVNVPEQPAPHITVEMPEPRRMKTEIQRDRDGNITGAVQKDA